MDSSENSTKLLGMPTYPDRSSSLSLDPISCRLVSPLRCPVPTGHSRHPLPTANFSVPLSHSQTGVPFLLPVTPRSQVQNPLSGFAPKQTKEWSARRTTYIVLQLFNTNYFIEHSSFFCAKSNGFKHCYVIPMIHFWQM